MWTEHGVPDMCYLRPYEDLRGRDRVSGPAHPGPVSGGMLL